MTEIEFRDTIGRVMDVEDKKVALYAIFDKFNDMPKKDRHVMMNEVGPAFGIALHPFTGKYETKVLCKCEGTRHAYYFDGESMKFKGGRLSYDENGNLESITEDTYGEVIHFQNRIRM